MSKNLIERVDETIEKRSLLKHPFYQEWTKGTLPLESLKKYAAEYYHFEMAYPTFLSGVHYRCHDQSIRQLILDNLWDEEHGPENHVELWLKFCDGLGVDREEVRNGIPSEATSDLVKTYTDLTSTGPLAAGIAALYAYESQVPEVASVKLEGLKEFYDFDDDHTVSFFQVHQGLDLEHSEAEQNMMTALAVTEQDKDAVIEASESATRILWKFLGILRKIPW